MRVTFILPVAGMSGGISVPAIYAKFLLSRGHEVELISQPKTASAGMMSRLKALFGGRRVKPMLVSPHLTSLGSNHRVMDVQRPVTDSDLKKGDVVVATWWETAEWVARLSPDKGIGLYFIQGYETFPYLPIARVKATYRLPLNKIVVSHWLKQRVSEDAHGAPITVVENGVDKCFFHPVERTKSDRPTVGFLITASVYVKGVDIAVSAIKKLQAKHSNLRAIAFGSGVPLDKKLVPEFIEIHENPSQEQIRQIYWSCDLWIASSRSEGFNLTALEAMCCGTPVVSSRTGWPNGSISHRKNGCLVDVDSVNQLYEECMWLLSLGSEDWEIMSASAVESTCGMSLERACSDFEKALINALKCK